MQKPELMAPVGDWTMLKAAIDAGADAVYFGVKQFNMRMKAQNFSLEELTKVVDFCHKKHVKAYLTLNTIIFDNEIGELEETVKASKSAGIDMIICWDMAVLKMAKKYKVPICLSTQASVSNSESAKFYKSIGVKRIVLARECSLDQIKNIVKKSGVEIEVFIHGAMCISISGRCFLSHESFGKSANRGECQQPCRGEYLIKDPDMGGEYILGKDYVLSPKDLCAIQFIDKLIEAGVRSFKIEGRKRSPEYVSTVVSVYREAIDLYFKNKFTQKKKDQMLEKLKTVYNRGLSPGFYFGQPGKGDFATTTGSVATTNKLYIGKVANYYKKSGVVLFNLESGNLKLKDKIMIQGPTTGVIEHKIKYMEVNEKQSNTAKGGDFLCIKLNKLVRKNDKVFLIEKRQNAIDNNAK